MNYGIVSQEQLERIDVILTDKLIKLGVDCVIIIDMAGNIITALSFTFWDDSIFSIKARSLISISVKLTTNFSSSQCSAEIFPWGFSG